MAHPEVLGFHGQYSFLSNFEEGYPLTFNQTTWRSAKLTLPAGFERYTWLTSEHAYQALKSLDPAHWDAVAACATPGQAKRQGSLRKCPNLRPDWEQVKEEVMLAILRRKFDYLVLRDRLLATDNALLVEVNTWNDKYWGAVQTLMGLDGYNRLGVLLMFLRDEIRQWMAQTAVV